MANVISNYFKINKPGSIPGPLKTKIISSGSSRTRKTSSNSKSSESPALSPAYESASGKASRKFSRGDGNSDCDAQNSTFDELPTSIARIKRNQSSSCIGNSAKAHPTTCDNENVQQADVVTNKTLKNPRKRKISVDNAEVKGANPPLKLIKLTDVTVDSSPPSTLAAESVNKSGPAQPNARKSLPMSYVRSKLMRPENMEKINHLRQGLHKIRSGLTKPEPHQEKPETSLTKLLATKSKAEARAVSGESDAKVPAYQRYHALASKDVASSLLLPFKYKVLAEGFRCLDTVVSLMYNRHEICAFTKLKPAVQEMLRRTFDLKHLGQVKTVFPTAYHFRQEKLHMNRNLSTESHLTISPNMDCFPAGEQSSKDLINEDKLFTLIKPRENQSIGRASRVVDNYKQLNDEASRKFEKMTPSFLFARRIVFRLGLLQIVKKYHQDFLSSLDPPIELDLDEAITRWHPKFPVDSVPDLVASELPLPVEAQRYSTAIDVLNKVKGIYSQKIDNALEYISNKTVSTTEVETPKPQLHPAPVVTSPIKGIPLALLEKIRTREAAKIKTEMTRNPEADLRLKMITRLPDMARILRNLFIAEKKAAVSMADASTKVTSSYEGSVTPVEMEKYLYLLKEVAPDWLDILNIRAGVYLKMNKSMDFKIVLTRIENAHKLAAHT